VSAPRAQAAGTGPPRAGPPRAGPPRAGLAPLAEVSGAERELQSLLHTILIGGRWAIFLAEVLAVTLRLGRVHAAGVQGEVASGLLILYNLVALLTLYRLPHRQIPVALLLAADVATIGVLVHLTGGLDSPFNGLYFLVILLAAVYYDLPGALLVAGAAVGINLATAALDAGLWQDLLAADARTQTIPYLILHGAVAGYLVRLLKRLHERHVAVEERLREARHEEELRRHEAEVAREIQRASLPAPPRHARYETAVRFEPAREVGGDFYAYFTDRTRFAVMLGDVSGKGIPAALVSTSICHLVHWLEPLDDPDGLLVTLNHDLLERLPDEGYASALFALLDPQAESLTLYNAGHLPAIVVRDGDVRQLHLPNLPLGAFPETTFEPLAARFGGGDTLVLYSDALVEVRNAAGEQLLAEGLEQLVRRHGSLPVEELASRLVEEVRAFGEVTDDLTLVVVRGR
jgi:serine phosphatase RsbU (regulator of sigma subunit)